MISSLISLEEGRAEDGNLRGTLENLRFRIDSVSGLYRLRLAAGNPGIIHLPAYLERMVMDLAGSLERGDVAVTLDLAELSIDIARAGPIGIICTELVVNAFRHGLGGGRAGRLLVRLVEEEGSLELSVEDDGRGLGEGFDIEEGRGLGLQLARMLSLQLKGRLDAESPAVGGARFCLRLPFQG
jgi:two-component sensor histidine kinase